MHQSLILRELKRHIGKRGYRTIQANSKAIKRRTRAVFYPVIGLETIEYITSRLKGKLSPEQITGQLKNDIEKTIKHHHKTIHRFVWEDKKTRRGALQILAQVGEIIYS